MMTSENSLEQVYVWIWLPGATEPVVAGVLSRDNGRFIFNYGRSYLERKEAIAVYVPELPLVRGAIVPAPGLQVKWTENSSGEGCFFNPFIFEGAPEEILRLRKSWL